MAIFAAFFVSGRDAPVILPVVPAAPRPSGGFPYRDTSRTRKEIAKARERFGIPDQERIAQEALAQRVIAEVAKRQADRLERDEQKRFEELSRELALRGIEWDGRHLAALNNARQRIIDAEIGLRLNALRRREDEEIVLLMLIASSL